MSDDLTTAQHIAKRAFAETSKDQQPFDIRNQTITRSGDRNTSLASSLSNDRSCCSGSHSSSSDGGSSSRYAIDHVCKDKSISVTSHCDLLPALSASQHNYARQYRGKDRNRHIGRCKSSLILAIEGDASIELVQWLIDMGHEAEDYSRDGRNCTMISLAAQHNRVDIIEALCTEAVANTASIHHQRHIEFDYHQRLRQHHRKRARSHQEEFEGEEDDDLDNTRESIDGSTLKSPSTGAKEADSMSNHQKTLPVVPPRSTSQGRKVSIGSTTTKEVKEDEDGDDDDARLSREIRQLLDSPDDLGRTALALACMKGYQEVVDKLLEIGSDINLPDFEGNTPLHYAAAYNHILIVQLLIERGCSFASKNTVGFTAADYAYTSSLKGALEAFARTKHDRDRKQLVHEITPDQTNMPIIHKSKNKTSNPAKTMHHSAQHRLATQLRELHF